MRSTRWPATASAIDFTLRGEEDRGLRKSLDGYTTLGPWLTTPDEAGRIEDLRISLAVNGTQRQGGRTGDMIHGVARDHRLRVALFPAAAGRRDPDRHAAGRRAGGGGRRAALRDTESRRNVVRGTRRASPRTLRLARETTQGRSSSCLRPPSAPARRRAAGAAASAGSIRAPAGRRSRRSRTSANSRGRVRATSRRVR